MIALSNHQFQELQAHTTALQAHSQAILDILTKVKQQELTQTFDPSEMYPMRPMTKKELANMLGVSSRHLAYQIQKGTRFTISFAKFLHGAACSCHSSRLPALTRYSEWYFLSHSVPSSSPPPSASYPIHCLKNSTENFEKSEISQNSHFSQCKFFRKSHLHDHFDIFDHFNPIWSIRSIWPCYFSILFWII